MTEKKNKSAIQRRLIPTYIFLIIVSFISVFPLYWMISAATNTTTDVSRGRILPGTYFMENFKNLTAQQPLWRALGNSLFYAVLTTVLCLLICSIAGYGFEVYVLQSRTLKYSGRFYPSDPFYTIHDHDVPSECKSIPDRHY